jgi:RimJ/RimL family protein N-acetyltransferase
MKSIITLFHSLGGPLLSIYLRDLTQEDIKTINIWRNDKELIDYLVSTFRFVNIETDEQWFDQYMKNRSNQVRLAIIEEYSNQFVGMIHLLDIDFINRTANVGFLIGGKKDRGKGYGTQAVLKILEHAFNNLNLNRVFSCWLEENKRSIQLAKKCGFIEEGILRHHVYKNGEYKNLLILSILKGEFIKLQSQISYDENPISTKKAFSRD